MIICDKCKKEIKKGRIGICPDCGKITCGECMERADGKIRKD